MDKKINILRTPFEGVFILESNYFEDSRGKFGRIYCFEELETCLKSKLIKQINHSVTTKKGTLRGLHYQIPPFSETKIIKCLKGKIYDVIIDIRRNSETFLKYFHIELSENENKMLLIPEGFAHGFQTLTRDVEILYFHTNIYNKENECSISAFDPRINIFWPLKISEISDKDKNIKLLNESFKGILI
jgi:dTDP-4-dehydrorhamnose 3,5-epimerase